MAEDVCGSCGRPFGAGLALEDDTGRARPRRWGLLLKQLVILNVLFVVWRVVGHVSLFHEAGAFSRGRWIWHAERAMHLPSEASLQRALLPHATLSQVANAYYEYAHATLLAATLLWLLWRHRDVYSRWRNLAVAFTGVSLLIGFLPVAPPRLVPSLGMVDLAARYHQSVYTALGKGISDQLSCLPSVHVGWAVLVAGAVIAVGRSRWRWLAVLHPLVTTYVVVATANHYWLDALAALVVLVVVYSALRRVGRGLVP
jgi:hypothetical protein